MPPPARVSQRQAVLDVAMTVFLARTQPWRFLLPVAQTLFGVLTFLGGLYGADHEDRGDYAWIAVAVVSLAGLGVLQFGKEWAHRRSEHLLAAQAQLDLAGAAQQSVTIRNALQPLAEHIALMPPLSRGKRIDYLEVVGQAAVGALQLALAPVDGLRSVAYELDDTGDRMRVLAYAGGLGQRPAPFVRHTSGGDPVFAMVEAAGSVFEPDLAARRGRQGTPPYAGGGHHYETYIAVSIHDTTRAFGMVTVDAPVAGSFAEVDEHVLHLVADLLAIAFSIARH